MLPNVAENTFDSSGLKVTPTIGIGAKGRRALSSKSARLTTFPFDPSFNPSKDPNFAHTTQRKSFLPFSATSPSKQKLHFQHNHNAPVATIWRNTGGPNWARPEYPGRARAHSHKVGCKTSSGTQAKSMPYLVDPRNNSFKAKIVSPTSFNDSSEATRGLEKNSLEKDALTGEMIMMGTGKSPVANSNVPLIATKVQTGRERLQVCRTKEEKDKNPDCIRLDKCALRLFPDIGGGESTTLKLLSLQHNLITKLENVPLLSQLVVLDLYDNRVERICGLQGLPSLRVLLLGKNRIKRIEGMDSLKRLEILDLHGNQLRYVDNLGPLSALRVLNLAGNLLRNIRNFGPYGMSSLTELNLKRNRIKNLDGLQKAPYLKRLLIANNDLQSISCLGPLRKLLYLQELIIEPNPLTSFVTGTEYRNQVLTLFPNLSCLDRTSVTEEMKVEAKQWHKIKLVEEEERKKREAKLKQELVATVGPPGSREQVIYQARRRWESLRTFVKSSATSADGKSKPLKSMKAVISATISAKAAKPRPNFNELYPPATLDLEQFPDGQVEFDQMESLLGDTKSVVPSGPTEAGQKKNDESCSESKPLAPDGDLARTPQIVCKIHDEIKPVSSVSLSQHTPMVSITEKSKNESKSSDTHSSSNKETATNSEPEIINNKSSFPIQSNHPINHERGFETQKEENNCKSVKEVTDSGRSNISLNSTKSTASENKQSTKVAVVRPLIRGTDEILEFEQAVNVETSELQHINVFESSASSATTDSAPSIPTMSQDDPSSEIKVITEIQDKAISEEVNSTYEPNRDGLREGEGTDSIEKVKNVGLEDDGPGQPMAINSGSKVPSPTSTNLAAATSSEQPSKTELEKSSTSPLQLIEREEYQPQPSSTSSRAKSKLLQHLRSISLDSGMQPPPSTPPESSELFTRSPEDDDEEEEDNENEIRDFECDYDYDGGADVDAQSVTTSTTTATSASTTPRRSSTVIATTNRLLKNSASFRKQTFPRTKSQRLKLRDRAARLFGSASDLSPRSNSTTTKRISSGVGIKANDNHNMNHSAKPTSSGKVLRRCDSATNLTLSGGTSTGASGSTAIPVNGTTVTVSKMPGGSGVEDAGGTPYRKQGVDFLVEVEGKSLNVFGQGGLRHALTAFTSNVTCHVNVAKFHYITYDSIIPYFGKLRQVYPSAEHFHFRANNLCTLAQLDALSDLQGLSSLYIAKEGNPVVAHEAWAHYASYRLSHWGLQVINGKEVSSEYRGGVTSSTPAKCFESLGFLALSCLPQTALTPLAKRLHMLHCFCCCSPSTSSDESNKPQRLAAGHHHRGHSPSQQAGGFSGNFCTAWDDDPVLLDVIGKEALVYCPPLMPAENDPNAAEADPVCKEQERCAISDKSGVKRDLYEKKRSDTLKRLIYSGVEIVEKVDRLERTWPTLMTEVIQEILMDYRFMDSYMKKELKKAQDAALIAGNQLQQQQHGKRFRH